MHMVVNELTCAREVNIRIHIKYGNVIWKRKILLHRLMVKCLRKGRCAKMQNKTTALNSYITEICNYNLNWHRTWNKCAQVIFKTQLALSDATSWLLPESRLQALNGFGCDVISACSIDAIARVTGNDCIA